MCRTLWRDNSKSVSVETRDDVFCVLVDKSENRFIGEYLAEQESEGSVTISCVYVVSADDAHEIHFDSLKVDEIILFDRDNLAQEIWNKRGMALDALITVPKSNIARSYNISPEAYDSFCTIAGVKLEKPGIALAVTIE